MRFIANAAPPCVLAMAFLRRTRTTINYNVASSGRDFNGEQVENAHPRDWKSGAGWWPQCSPDRQMTCGAERRRGRADEFTGCSSPGRHTASNELDQ
jgi:hypothetical protein